jgi:hypothetical protein
LQILDFGVAKGVARPHFQSKIRNPKSPPQTYSRFPTIRSLIHPPPAITIFRQSVVQRPPAHAQVRGGGGAVADLALQRREDVAILGVG